MNFTFSCLLIFCCVCVLRVQAVFNKDVVCEKDQGASYPNCKTVPSPSRRLDSDITEPNIPVYDPYIPRIHSLFYNCSSLDCKPINLYSITEISNTNLNLKSCYQGSGKFECEPIRYNYFKNIDKLLFLKNNLENKTFYLVDCFVFKDFSRVCHKKEDDNTAHADLVKLAAVAKPKEPSALSQDEFLCEETVSKVVTCDLDPYIPFRDGLRLKNTVKIEGTIVLKTGNYVVGLHRQCFDPWCGFTGQIISEVPKIPGSKRNYRRSNWFEKYDPPGGNVYRCYYAKRQQICKLLYDKHKEAYNKRDWLNNH